MQQKESKSKNKTSILDQLNDSFSHQIYKKLLELPSGKITTYKELAKATFGEEFKGYRAVGTALNKNPFAPTVPCHRVINSNGKLGGFAFGNKEKIKRLSQENVEVTTKGKIKLFKKKLHKF